MSERRKGFRDELVQESIAYLREKGVELVGGVYLDDLIVNAKFAGKSTRGDMAAAVLVCFAQWDKCFTYHKELADHYFGDLRYLKSALNSAEAEGLTAEQRLELLKYPLLLVVMGVRPDG